MMFKGRASDQREKTSGREGELVLSSPMEARRGRENPEEWQVQGTNSPEENHERKFKEKIQSEMKPEWESENGPARKQEERIEEEPKRKEEQPVAEMNNLEAKASFVSAVSSNFINEKENLERERELQRKIEEFRRRGAAERMGRAPEPNYQNHLEENERKKSQDGRITSKVSSMLGKILEDENGQFERRETGEHGKTQKEAIQRNGIKFELPERDKEIRSREEGFIERERRFENELHDDFPQERPKYTEVHFGRKGQTEEDAEYFREVQEQERNRETSHFDKRDLYSSCGPVDYSIINRALEMSNITPLSYASNFHDHPPQVPQISHGERLSRYSDFQDYSTSTQPKRVTSAVHDAPLSLHKQSQREKIGFNHSKEAKERESRSISSYSKFERSPNKFTSTQGLGDFERDLSRAKKRLRETLDNENFEEELRSDNLKFGSIADKITQRIVSTIHGASNHSFHSNRLNSLLETKSFRNAEEPITRSRVSIPDRSSRFNLLASF